MRRLLTAAEEEAASWRLRSSQDQSLADLRDSELRKKSAAVRGTHSLRLGTEWGDGGGGGMRMETRRNKYREGKDRAKQEFEERINEDW
jgi:hypothetical protein